MNKRFSTLLAGVLLAGGTFSVQTVSADEAALLKSLGKYYQVEVATDKYLVIGQGEMRDSLAVWEKADIKTLDQLNETLWSVKFTPVIGSNGQIAEYEMRLFNKVGNRQLILTTSLVEPGKTFHKSPYAVLGSEGIDKWTVDLTEYDRFTTNSKLDWHSYKEPIYSAQTDRTTEYRLVAKDGVIKLQAQKSAEQDGEDVNNNWETPYPNEGISTVALVFTPYESAYAFDAEELNGKGNDGFTLAFSNDVVNNKYANPFSEYTLHATAEPIYTAATYNVSYATNLTAVKEAYEQLDNLVAAVNDYAEGMEEAFATAKRLAKIDKAQQIRYDTLMGWRDLLKFFSKTESQGIKVNIDALGIENRPEMEPGKMYFLPITD